MSSFHLSSRVHLKFQLNLPESHAKYEFFENMVTGTSLVTQRILLQCERPGLDPWVGKIPWRRELLPTSVFLPRKFHGQWSLVGYSHAVAKSQTQLSY